ncbi:hypothetical protein GCM10027569_08930 [Flindersiella endophytica]
MTGPAIGAVGDPVVLGTDAGQTLAAIRQLRDALTAGVVPTWYGELDRRVPFDLVCHLPPPEGRGAVHDRWRSGFRPGLCYFRRGPGFLRVRDARDRETTVDLVIDDDDLIGTFTRCLLPTSLTRLTPAERAAVNTLIEERLMLELDGKVVTLPHRMRRWPVPAIEV